MKSMNFKNVALPIACILSMLILVSWAFNKPPIPGIMYELGQQEIDSISRDLSSCRTDQSSYQTLFSEVKIDNAVAEIGDNCDALAKAMESHQNDIDTFNRSEIAKALARGESVDKDDLELEAMKAIGSYGSFIDSVVKFKSKRDEIPFHIMSAVVYKVKNENFGKLYDDARVVKLVHDIEQSIDDEDDSDSRCYYRDLVTHSERVNSPLPSMIDMSFCYRAIGH